MRFITMLAALAVTAAMVTPAANARPIVDVPAAAACDPSAVPPPPSSIAASAAKDYAALRACGGQDDSTIVGLGADRPRAVAADRLRLGVSDDRSDRRSGVVPRAGSRPRHPQADRPASRERVSRRGYDRARAGTRTGR